MSAASESFWATLPLGREVTLLAYDANGIVAFNKPAGVLSHPNDRGDEPRSLLNARYVIDGEFFQWEEKPGTVRRLWLLNRLDSATSGVILAAAHEKLATEVRGQFKKKQVRKVYQALVFGVPRLPTEVWRDLLAVEKHGGKIRTGTHAGHVPAECKMIVSRSGKSDPRVSLLRLEPRTGRSHQLRVQCAKRHLPIVGDQTYGDFPKNRAFAKVAGTKRLFLHSLETAFDYEYGGKRQAFAAKAPLPEEFGRAL